MKIGIVGDALVDLKPEMDTTLLIASAAASRGHEVFYADQTEIWRTENGVYGKWGALFYSEHRPSLPQDCVSDLSLKADTEFDVILMRQDPPVNERYIAVTHILDGCITPVVNSPSSVQRFNEKIAILKLPELCPPSIVTLDWDEIRSFWSRSQNGAVIKPLNEFNGRGVLKLSVDYEEQEVFKLVRHATNDFSEFCIIQVFVKDVELGDKRFFLLNGDSIGHMKRIPPKGDWRSNIHLGATPVKFEPSERDFLIIKEVKNLLSNYDIPLACIDVIGDFLTEINVTSPSGIPEINKVYDVRLHEIICDWLEAQYA